MPTLQAEPTERKNASQEIGDADIEELKPEILKHGIEQVVNQILDLGSATQENKAQRDVLGVRLLELCNMAQLDGKQRKDLFLEIRQRRTEKPTKKLPSENDDGNQDLPKEPTEEMKEEQKEKFPEDIYANLLSFNKLEKSLATLPIQHKGDRVRAFIEADRADRERRGKGMFTSNLIREAARIIEIDLPPPYELRLSFTDAVDNCMEVAQEAIQRRKKERQPITLKEAAKWSEVSLVIEKLYEKIDTNEKIPGDKKKAVFAFLKEATGVAYEPEEEEVADEELLEKVA